MTALAQAERSARAAAKRAAKGEVELRHRVRPGIRAMLDDIMRWHGIEEQAEAIQLLILNAHAAGTTSQPSASKSRRWFAGRATDITDTCAPAGADRWRYSSEHILVREAEAQPATSRHASCAGRVLPW